MQISILIVPASGTLSRTLGVAWIPFLYPWTPPALNCLQGINTLTKLLNGHTKWSWQAQTFIANERKGFYFPLLGYFSPSLFCLWSSCCKIKLRLSSKCLWPLKLTLFFLSELLSSSTVINPFSVCQLHNEPFRYVLILSLSLYLWNRYVLLLVPLWYFHSSLWMPKQLILLYTKLCSVCHVAMKYSRLQSDFDTTAESI